MGATLVARYWHKGQIKTRVWYADNIFIAIERAHKAANRISEARPGRLRTWNPRIDAQVLQDYKSIGPSQIARNLTAHYKRKFTKNMVISRYHRIKHV